MADFDAVVQILPINGVAARFQRPVRTLLGRGFCQPFQPRHVRKRKADLSSVAEFHTQNAAREADAFGTNLIGCLSSQSVHSMPPIILRDVPVSVSKAY